MLKHGETKRLAAAAGIHPSTIRNRLRRGWTLEQACLPAMKPWASGNRPIKTRKKDADRFCWMLANGELGTWTRDEIDKEMQVDSTQRALR